MGIIGWIVFGAIAGWIASIITGDNPSMGLGANIIVGLVGSFIGGFIGTRIFNIGDVSGFNLQSFFIAVLGAVILLLGLRMFRGRR